MTLVPGDLMTMDPQAINDPVGMDWTARLAEIASTETIVGSTWTYTGRDALMTLSSSAIVTGSKKTQVRRSGGSLGAKYTLVNHITTSSGVEDDRTIYVLMQQA